MFFFGVFNWSTRLFQTRDYVNMNVQYLKHPRDVHVLCNSYTSYAIKSDDQSKCVWKRNMPQLEPWQGIYNLQHAASSPASRLWRAVKFSWRSSCFDKESYIEIFLNFKMSLTSASLESSLSSSDESWDDGLCKVILINEQSLINFAQNFCFKTRPIFNCLEEEETCGTIETTGQLKYNAEWRTWTTNGE